MFKFFIGVFIGNILGYCLDDLFPNHIHFLSSLIQ